MAPASSAGYSGTPLVKKLGYKAGAHVALIGAPEGYAAWVAPLPQDVVFDAAPGSDTSMVHLFATTRSRLGRQLGVLRQKLSADAAVWVSWPKKAAKVETDITEDVIRELALPLGFIDVKVCAVDATWSALKLVVRKALRPQ